MSLADAGGMHQRTMIWTTAKRCRPGKMRPFHACMLRGKEKPDYPQASAISQSEKQRSIKVESSLSSTTYRYNSWCCTAIGKTNKVSFRRQEKSWASWQCSNAQDPSWRRDDKSYRVSAKLRVIRNQEEKCRINPFQVQEFVCLAARQTVSL